MAPALFLALALMAADTPPAADAPTAAAASASDHGEPLPPGAPTDDYELSAWCYGALGEYLHIYDHVKPDLIEIDKQWGTTVQEDEPYQSDMAAARKELKQLANAVTAAEKASPRPIAQRGVQAIHQGEGIWAPAETKSSRELARAWLSWGLPDRCDSVSRDLLARSVLLGRALNANAGSAIEEDEAAPRSPLQSTIALQPFSAPHVQPNPNPEPAPTPPVAEVIAGPSPPPVAEQTQAAPIQTQPSAEPPTSTVLEAAEPPAQTAAAKPPAQPKPTPTLAPSAAAPPTDQSMEPTL
ncbi:MAG: hypothetical protein ACHP84_02935 [Caulobacterales bacterium]